MVEYFEGKYFKWKLEGNAITIQNLVAEKMPTIEEFFGDEEYLLQKIKEWKSEGYKIIEFWVPPLCHAMATSFFAENKIEMETLRIQKDGNAFCRLLL